MSGIQAKITALKDKMNDLLTSKQSVNVGVSTQEQISGNFAEMLEFMNSEWAHVYMMG